MKWAVMSAIVLLAWFGVASGQEMEKYPPPELESVSPPKTLNPVHVEPPEVIHLVPGQHAPAFETSSSFGRTFKLSDLQGHWSVLEFDMDRTRFATLAAVDDSVVALGARQYGVCDDEAGTLKHYADKHKIGFPLLSDPTGEISALFGMYDQDNDVIQPGVVILDPRGIVSMAVPGPVLDTADVLTMLRHAMSTAKAAS